jgi:hypothetical protein
MALLSVVFALLATVMVVLTFFAESVALPGWILASACAVVLSFAHHFYVEFRHLRASQSQGAGRSFQ